MLWFSNSHSNKWEKPMDEIALNAVGFISTGSKWKPKWGFGCYDNAARISQWIFVGLIVWYEYVWEMHRQRRWSKGSLKDITLLHIENMINDRLFVRVLKCWGGMHNYMHLLFISFVVKFFGRPRSMANTIDDKHSSVHNVTNECRLHTIAVPF